MPPKKDKTRKEHLQPQQAELGQAEQAQQGLAAAHEERTLSPEPYHELIRKYHREIKNPTANPDTVIQTIIDGCVKIEDDRLGDPFPVIRCFFQGLRHGEISVSVIDLAGLADKILFEIMLFCYQTINIHRYKVKTTTGLMESLMVCFIRHRAEGVFEQTTLIDFFTAITQLVKSFFYNIKLAIGYVQDTKKPEHILALIAFEKALTAIQMEHSHKEAKHLYDKQKLPLVQCNELVNTEVGLFQLLKTLLLIPFGDQIMWHAIHGARAVVGMKQARSLLGEDNEKKYQMTISDFPDAFLVQLDELSELLIYDALRMEVQFYNKNFSSAQDFQPPLREFTTPKNVSDFFNMINQSEDATTSEVDWIQKIVDEVLTPYRLNNLQLNESEPEINDTRLNLLISCRLVLDGLNNNGHNLSITLMTAIFKLLSTNNVRDNKETLLDLEDDKETLLDLEKEPVTAQAAHQGLVLEQGPHDDAFEKLLAHCRTVSLVKDALTIINDIEKKSEKKTRKKNRKTKKNSPAKKRSPSSAHILLVRYFLCLALDIDNTAKTDPKDPLKTELLMAELPPQQLQTMPASLDDASNQDDSSSTGPLLSTRLPSHRTQPKPTTSTVEFLDHVLADKTFPIDSLLTFLIDHHPADFNHYALMLFNHIPSLITLRDPQHDYSQSTVQRLIDALERVHHHLCQSKPSSSSAQDDKSYQSKMGQFNITLSAVLADICVMSDVQRETIRGLINHRITAGKLKASPNKPLAQLEVMPLQEHEYPSTPSRDSISFGAGSDDSDDSDDSEDCLVQLSRLIAPQRKKTSSKKSPSPTTRSQKNTSSSKALSVRPFPESSTKNASTIVPPSKQRQQNLSHHGINKMRNNGNSPNQATSRASAASKGGASSRSAATNPSQQKKRNSKKANAGNQAKIAGKSSSNNGASPASLPQDAWIGWASFAPTPRESFEKTQGTRGEKDIRLQTTVLKTHQSGVKPAFATAPDTNEEKTTDVTTRAASSASEDTPSSASAPSSNEEKLIDDTTRAAAIEEITAGNTHDTTGAENTASSDTPSSANASDSNVEKSIDNTTGPTSRASAGEPASAISPNSPLCAGSSSENIPIPPPDTDVAGTHGNGSLSTASSQENDSFTSSSASLSPSGGSAEEPLISPKKPGKKRRQRRAGTRNALLSDGERSPSTDPLQNPQQLTYAQLQQQAAWLQQQAAWLYQELAQPLNQQQAEYLRELAVTLQYNNGILFHQLRQSVLNPEQVSWLHVVHERLSRQLNDTPIQSSSQLQQQQQTRNQYQPLMQPQLSTHAIYSKKGTSNFFSGVAKMIDVKELPEKTWRIKMDQYSPQTSTKTMGFHLMAGMAKIYLTTKNEDHIALIGKFILFNLRLTAIEVDEHKVFPIEPTDAVLCQLNGDVFEAESLYTPYTP